MRVWLLLACLLSWPVLAVDYPSPAGSCCRYCTRNSQPCGNSCIPVGFSCRKTEGCACSSANPRPGHGSIYQQGFADGLSIGLELGKRVLSECGATPSCLQLLDVWANAGTSNG